AVAQGISTRLSELDAAHAADYGENLERFRSQLEAARVGWEKRLAPLKGAPVIAYHNSIVYLADWVGFVPVAFLEPKPGIPPNPSHVAEVLTLARQRKVKLVLQEEFYPDTTSRLIASKAPAALVVLPAGTDVRSGESYV
ncbi:metal ABC transporter substrate-binding protein, partial [Escherichia coli]|uniref:metal ABC transporter substrate-binding protein n=1 Tax=Escherichia coli TaxID=562 RepID=UPI00215776D8